MNYDIMIDKLKEEIKTNETAKNVLYVLAMRQRNRSSISTSGLYRKLRAEGFSNTKSECAEVLKTLSMLNLGVLKLNTRGNVKYLTNIPVSLQTIGRLAYDTSIVSNQGIVKKPAVLIKPIIMLIVKIKNKNLSIPIPDNFNKDEISEIISRFRE